MANHSKLEEQLRTYFNHSQFREGQKEIIQSVLDGRHTLATLPTGSGKSITYQLPALIAEGVTVVVSPLISLMVDQVKILKSKGIKKVAAINSLVDEKAKQKLLNNLNKYKLIYCSPEMLQQERVMKRLRQVNVSYFVVDEAHCISQWGHEFRTDYMKLHTIFKQLKEPTVLALSATATPQVQDDIIKHLQIKMDKIIHPVDRPNITFSLKKVEGQQHKEDSLKDLLHNNHVPTMVYFSSRQVSEEVARKLQKQFPKRKVAYYHGGMDQDDRLLIQQQFMYDQLDVICCTSAFGMGVDKANIRLIVHYHMPSNLESYIQEVGRAGRDGEHSVATLFYQPGDETIPFQLISQELPDDDELEWFISERLNGNEVEGLSETKERFLKYQLELNSSIQNHHDMINALKRVRDDRLQAKRESILKMLNWLHYSGCRREALYHSFQDGVKNATTYCCDHCDFNLDNWVFQNQMSDHKITFYWENRLNAIFNRR
ncbi:ATP-dependent DNA helicase RecQ [Alkalibacillus filiformis]|uniref:ATP-dependent DNA helicase RecQ n=1 Tax=Alkalibacillus filiformis TaxID=200990 RepID=A0ABU0DR08_9BACI|nr:RecQ family ATP-dependent DNA helicase [Alkalibacillus filiformis]MDQ0350883.1 ATP-dependent DNA helicase RecQ [Alkalibacillus filiformis]